MYSTSTVRYGVMQQLPSYPPVKVLAFWHSGVPMVPFPLPAYKLLYCTALYCTVLLYCNKAISYHVLWSMVHIHLLRSIRYRLSQIVPAVQSRAIIDGVVTKCAIFPSLASGPQPGNRGNRGNRGADECFSCCC
jgi:hypothetical protein